MATQTPTQMAPPAPNGVYKEAATSNNTCPVCSALDPADRERLVNCAGGIRLRAGGALGWITPWCCAELPNETLKSARVGGVEK